MRKAVLYTPLRVLVSTLILTLAAFGLTASAQVIFSSDESQFLSDNPDLDFQNFLSAPAPDGNFIVCNAPVDADSSDACFTPGQILPGIAFFDNPGPDAGSMLVFGANYVSNANPRGPLTTNTFADTFDIIFSDPDTTRAGFLAGCMVVGGPCSDQMTVQVFGAGDALIGSTSVAVSSAFTGFVGVTSDETITRINLSNTIDPANNVEGILNISFGAPPTPPPAPVVTNIPTLSEWGMITTALMLAAFGMLALRRRRTV
ncbi:MAG: IPTL-CTERM sorting domain-containing protein, partial [Candidatus Dadabacteria bacterium]|nr:IPTL-CTERM sorting domain-containing protein [Candidatus Dadabacteria bacterium]